MNIQPIVTISSIFDAEVTTILFISKFSVHLIGALVPVWQNYHYF